MPVTHSFDEDGSLVLCRADGVIDDVTLIAHLRQLAADERVKPQHRVSFDFRAVEDCTLTGQAVRGAAKLVEEMRARHDEAAASAPRVALLVPSDVAFGLGRMFCSLVAHLPGSVRVFRDEAEAQRWLDDGPGDEVAA